VPRHGLDIPRSTLTAADRRSAERGSITAIDHLAEQPVAEHGSITAIDHLAEHAAPTSETASRTP
jgi:hypothetical protein